MEVFRKDVVQILRKVVGGQGKLSTKEIEELLEHPQDAKHGDLSFPCFALAKELKKAPPVIAAELQEKLELSENIDKTAVISGYLNFFIKPEKIASEILGQIYSEGDAYGASDTGRGRKVIVEFSSPNIAKPFGIGHLRSTILGNCLSRVYRFLNYEVVALNHLGDWGTQFGKIIASYKHWGKADFLKGNPISNLYQLYVKFHEEEEKDSALSDEAREWFAKLEKGDQEATELWEWFRDLSMNELKGIYSTFDIHFDHQWGESFYTDKMPATIERLEQKHLLEESDGAQIVRLGDEMPPAIIKKSDASTLYLTRDLAAAEYRHEKFDFYRMLYIVGMPQELHFKQLFTVLEKMGHEWATNCEHVSFGHISFGDKGMSTRKGTIVFLSDVLNRAIELSQDIIKEKQADLEDPDKVATQIAIAALIYADFSARRRKDVKFSWEEILNFDGETGPYLQYTSVRVRSLLEKYTGTVTENVEFSKLNAPEELELIKHLSRFNEALLKTTVENEPFVLNEYATELCKLYNKFYNRHRILSGDGEASLARVLLTKCTSITLDNALHLLGIPIPERM